MGPHAAGGAPLPVRWRFVLAARDETTDQEYVLVDATTADSVLAPGNPLTTEYAVFLINELISQLKQKLQLRDIPYLGVCRTCGAVVDDQHLLGGERDVCDACWRGTRRGPASSSRRQ